MNRQAKEYYIVTDITSDQHAGQKARRDIEALAARRGMEAIIFRGMHTADRNRMQQVRLIRNGIGNWVKLLFHVRQHATILFQYPHYPIKSAYLNRWMIPLIRRLRMCSFVALIHDLNSLRDIGGKASVYVDRKLLPLFDRIICHNEAMRKLLIQRGISASRLICLEAFDYLISASDQRIPAAVEPSICIAGNLSREKCGYLYDLIQCGELSFALHLYGPNLDHDALLHPNVHYHGVVPADELPFVLEGKYGLVWDGDSLDTCTGPYGEYLQYNNPHKVSLYLAAGKPVIMWDKAAMADYIKQHQCGICIPSLRELIHPVDYFGGFIYNQYCHAVERVGLDIRDGKHFNEAWEKVYKE